MQTNYILVIHIIYNTLTCLIYKLKLSWVLNNISEECHLLQEVILVQNLCKITLKCYGGSSIFTINHKGCCLSSLWWICCGIVQAHNLKVNGSIPFPATIERLCRSCDRLFVCYLFVLFLRLSFSENGPSLFLNHPIQFLNQLKITKNHYQIHIDACIFHKVQYFSSIVVRWNMFLYGWAEVIIWKIGRKRGIPWCLPRDHLQMDRRQRHARPPYRPLLEVQERWGRCLGQIR